MVGTLAPWHQGAPLQAVVPPAARQLASPRPSEPLELQDGQLLGPGPLLGMQAPLLPLTPLTPPQVNASRLFGKASPQNYSLVVLGKFSGVLQSPYNPVGASNATSGTCVVNAPVIDTTLSVPTLTSRRDVQVGGWCLPSEGCLTWHTAWATKPCRPWQRSPPPRSPPPLTLGPPRRPLQVYFSSPVAVAASVGYQCKLTDGAGGLADKANLHDWRACSSPAVYASMQDAAYNFLVGLARAAAGPAARPWGGSVCVCVGGGGCACGSGDGRRGARPGSGAAQRRCRGLAARCARTSTPHPSLPALSPPLRRLPLPQVRVKGEDFAATLAFTVDSTPPSTSLTGSLPASGANGAPAVTATDNATFTFTASDISRVNFTCRWAGGRGRLRPLLPTSAGCALVRQRQRRRRYAGMWLCQVLCWPAPSLCRTVRHSAW
jgi:hypothetical protein